MSDFYARFIRAPKAQAAEDAPGVGIDFGTTNSSIAIFDGETLTVVKFRNKSKKYGHVPTASYIDRELLPTLGFQAISRFLKDNEGRVIELRREEVGYFEFSVSGTEKAGQQAEAEGITVEVNAQAFTDRNLPGRLFRSVKSWLGEPDVERVDVFGKKMRLVAVITPILKWLAESCPPVTRRGSIHFGRPVNFEGTDGANTNQLAVSRLSEAARHAGLPEPSFYPEPIAATLSFLHEHDTRPGEFFLTFDFGGGTLDLCVLERTESGFEIRSTTGIGLGGDALDRAIFQTKLFPALGEGVFVPDYPSAPENLRPFRFSDYADLLLNWQNAYQLNTRWLREQIRLGMMAGGEAEEKLSRLRLLIMKNLSYNCMRAVEQAKIALSREEETRIQVPPLGLEVPFSRGELEAIIGPHLGSIRSVVEEALELAGVKSSQLRAVVSTGGSSRIPRVKQLLHEVTGCEILQHSTFTGIAAGLAIANYHGYEWQGKGK